MSEIQVHIKRPEGEAHIKLLQDKRKEYENRRHQKLNELFEKDRDAMRKAPEWQNVWTGPISYLTFCIELIDRLLEKGEVTGEQLNESLAVKTVLLLHSENWITNDRVYQIALALTNIEAYSQDIEELRKSFRDIT